MTEAINKLKEWHAKMLRAYSLGKNKKARKFELKMTQYYATH